MTDEAMLTDYLGPYLVGIERQLRTLNEVMLVRAEMQAETLPARLPVHYMRRLNGIRARQTEEATPE